MNRRPAGPEAFRPPRMDHMTTIDHYVKEHEQARRAWAGTPAWLARLREDALERFLSLGFPTTRDEEWRFTSVAPIAEGRFSMGAAGHVQVSGAADGVTVESLASAVATRPDELEPYLTRLAPVEGHAFTALNTAFFADGVYIRVPAHVVLEAPIQVRFMSPAGTLDAMTHPRVLIVAGEQSQASIVERYAGEGGGRYLTNAVTEVVLGDAAVVGHYKLQQESMGGFHVGSMHVRAQRSASFASHSVSLGGSLVRNEIMAVLDGEGAHCTLNGLYLAGGQRLVDNHTTIDHAQPHCDSREVYKGILADRARGVFNGKIIVRPDAQKTDAKQTNRALLLSEDAQINTKPQLEIFANDVKCTHGATVGQLDDEAVFYLRSRGLGEADARRLLIQAFVGDVLNLMPLAPVRAEI